MQVPTRRADKLPRVKPDATITAEKYNELKSKLERLIKVSRPREAADVKHLASMGDFSENAGYQLAKARLRGINQRILDIEDLLKRAEIIRPSRNMDKAQLGHRVTVEINGRRRTYEILGSAETNPASGVISHNSPLGAALLGRCVGEDVEVRLAGKTVVARIIKIE
jgi:transcription elongation factor GreA